MTNEIPYGYCHCGCGQETSLWKSTDLRRGRVRGQPKHFIFGHTIALHNSKPHPTIPAEERFWKLVQVRGDNECWEWQGSRTADGYGRFHTVPGEHNVIASRFAWKLANGAILDGMNVLHRCDNPPCCNPKHLFLGTKLENNQDRSRKGRSFPLRGELNGHAKLTESDVRDAWRMHAQGMTYKAIAQHFHVSKAAITHALTGRNWKHLKLL